MDNVEQALEASGEPAGIVVRAANGAEYFLTDAQADQAKIRKNAGLYTAFRAIADRPGDRAGGNPSETGVVPERLMNCGFVKSWLDRTNPDSALWRSTCLAYFDNCA